MTTYRKRAIEIGLLLCGACLGAALAWSIAHYFQLKTGEAELYAYAGHMLSVGQQLAQETDEAVAKVLSGNLPFCSDAELNLMREFIFFSAHVKEMGRTRDGKLYCTTNSGRLAAPLKDFQPDLSVGNDRFIMRSPLIIAPQSKAMIVESRGVTVVLNPESYDFLNQPPMTFSGLLFDPASRRVLQGFGRPMPLTNAEVLAQQMIERDGVFYQPLCSKAYVVCVIAAEPRAAMLAADQGHMLAFLVGGALLGGSFALILILFYHRQRSLDRRLRRAVRQGQLSVVYQPIVDLRARAKSRPLKVIGGWLRKS